jgi:5-formyltetrahydrofolate cyclo-ligase
VPVTDADFTLTPVFVTEKSVYSTGRHKIEEPGDRTNIAKLDEIDVFIIPGVAFGRNFYRIGYGKGCYDSLLGDARGVKIGVGFSAQIFDDLKPEAHDVPMDMIVTEEGVFITL